MVLWVLFGFLAAFGAASAVWCLAGFLLPGCRGTAVWVGEAAFVRRWAWLRELGMVPRRLLWADCPLPEADRAAWAAKGVEFCGLAELPARLKEEAGKLGGPGDGDPAGHGERRGLSEL